MNSRSSIFSDLCERRAPRNRGLGRRLPTAAALLAIAVLPLSARAEPEPPPRNGLALVAFNFERFPAASSGAAQSGVFAQAGYGRRLFPSGLYVGGALELGVAGGQRELGLGLHAGWDIGSASKVVLDGYLAPVEVRSTAAADPRPSGIGLVAGASLSVPWLTQTFFELAYSSPPESYFLALPLVLLPQSIGLRFERIPGHQGTRFSGSLGWSFAVPLWE